MLDTERFIVLYGSYARRDFTRHSDIDVCVIGVEPEDLVAFVRSQVHSDAPVSILIYAPEQFETDYRRGKLFLHHILSEGELLTGNYQKWEALRQQFVVQTTFVEDIEHELAIAALLGQTELFGGKYLHALSHGFLTLKNVAICILATRGIYEYNKDKSIHRVFAEIIPQESLALLRKAHRLTLGTTSHEAKSVDCPLAPIALKSLHPLIRRILDVRS